MSGAAAGGVVEAALALRAWALAALAGDPRPAPEAPAAAWEVFLAVERCGAPLQSRLLAAGLAPPPDGPARAALERIATRDLQRTVAARAVLALCGRLCAERGWPCVALKSGAALAEGGEPTDRMDVDVLVRPEHALPLAALLEARGFQPPPTPELPPGSPHVFELGPRMGPMGIPVEVHFAVAYVGRIDPWDGAVATAMPGVRRMSPANHLWHVLAHGVLHHPERRGALRELMQLAAAAAWCAPADLAEVERRAAEHAQGPALLDVLAAARALVEGRVPADRFALTAATAYLLYLRLVRRPPPRALVVPLTAASHALAWGTYAALWGRGPDRVLLPRDYPGWNALDRAAPLAGWAARVAWRGGTLAAVTLPALLLARRARKAALGQA